MEHFANFVRMHYCNPFSNSKITILCCQISSKLEIFSNSKLSRRKYQKAVLVNGIGHNIFRKIEQTFKKHLGPSWNILRIIPTGIVTIPCYVQGSSNDTKPSKLGWCVLKLLMKYSVWMLHSPPKRTCFPTLEFVDAKSKNEAWEFTYR